MEEFPVHLETLANGLTVALREVHRAPVATLQVWVAVGAADEAPDEAGLAHFHEHMLFKGTERRGVAEIAGAIEGAGGRINAYTSYDLTVYHATVPSDAVDLALDVLADAIRHSRFDPEEIAREIEVVLEEIRRSEDSPAHVASNALLATAYRVHPYGRPILGTPESVARIDRSRLRAFFERWYAPDRITVVAAGDFEAPALAARIRALFADAQPGGARRQRPPEPPWSEPRAAVVARPFERVTLEVAFPIVSASHPDAPLLDLAAYLLGGGESSRLVRRVQERDGLVDRIEASAFTPLDPGLFGVSADLDPERCEAALEAILREIGRLRIDSVSDEELEKGRTNFLASLHFDREMVNGQAQRLGHALLLAGGIESEQRYIETIRRATQADLERVLREQLDPRAWAVVAVVPEEGAEAVGTKRLLAAGTRALERGRKRVTPRPVSAFGPVSAPPPRRMQAQPIRAYELPGGIRLYVERQSEIPVFAARAALLGGLLVEDEKTCGVTSFLTSMWLRGTRDRSAAELARAIESLGAELDGFAGRNTFGLALEAPSEHGDAALDLLAEVLAEPDFEPTEIERERRETLAAIARHEDRLAARVFDLFCETHWRRHPYRLPLVGRAEVVKRLDREALRAHQQRWVRAANLVLAVSGDVDPERLAGRLARRLESLADAGFEPPAVEIEPPPREVRRAELHRPRAQAHLVLGFRGLTLDDPDRYALEVLAQILAGQGGRLFLELRDRRGLAYAVSAVNVEGLAPGFFAVYIGTAPEKLEAARRGMLEELARVRERAPAPAEIERARRHLIGATAIDRQRAAVRAARMALDARCGLGADADLRYPERIASVTEADLRRVAERVIDLDAYTEACIVP